MTKVDVFGTFHVDCPEKVKTELRAFSEQSDLFLVELPRQRTKDSDWLRLAIRNPAMLIAGKILNFFWGSLGFLLTGRYGSVERQAIQEIARQRDIDIEPVDLNLVRRAGKARIYTTVVSWMSFLLMIALAVIAVRSHSVYLALWALIVGFGPVVPFAYMTLSERDNEIAQNIEAILSQSDSSQGCLVVGRKHMRGVIDQMEETSVEVGNTHKPKWCRRNKDSIPEKLTNQ